MTPNVAIASAFLNAMKAKDLSGAPVAEGVSYEGPLSGEAILGRDHVLRFLETYLPVIQDIQVERHFTDADYVATVWRAETKFGPVSLVYVFRIELGKIARIQAFYDPRGFLARMGSHEVR